MMSESAPMRLARACGLEGLAWSLRRLHCPVPRGALVLEVGSGGNPYPRANVLLDAYIHTRERHWETLVADRPMVLGRAERLPFRDKAFDFVIAAHVLEHSRDPERFLSELSRVAKAGYIEVPDAFMERINPYLDHRLEVTERGGELLIRKKRGHLADPELVELYTHKAGVVIAGDTMRRFPFHFHVRHYWTGSVRFRVLNPGVDADWPAPPSGTAPLAPSWRKSLRRGVLRSLRAVLSQCGRNSNINIIPLLACPGCRSGMNRAEGAVTCSGCGTRYTYHDGVPDLTPRTS